MFVGAKNWNVLDVGGWRLFSRDIQMQKGLARFHEINNESLQRVDEWQEVIQWVPENIVRYSGLESQIFDQSLVQLQRQLIIDIV